MTEKGETAFTRDRLMAPSHAGAGWSKASAAVSLPVETGGTQAGERIGELWPILSTSKKKGQAGSAEVRTRTGR